MGLFIKFSDKFSREKYSIRNVLVAFSDKFAMDNKFHQLFLLLKISLKFPRNFREAILVEVSFDRSGFVGNPSECLLRDFLRGFFFLGKTLLTKFILSEMS